MKVRLLCILLITLVVDAKRIDKSTALKTSKKCLITSNVHPTYTAKFSRFEFPDDKGTHDFLHCFWSDLDVWNSIDGFKEREVADQIDDSAYVPGLMAVVRRCNRNSANHPPPKRVHQSYTCILNSRPGQQLRAGIKKRITD